MSGRERRSEGEEGREGGGRDYLESSDEHGGSLDCSSSSTDDQHFVHSFDTVSRRGHFETRDKLLGE